MVEFTQLQRGDVLFYKTTMDGTTETEPGSFDGLVETDFERFEVLAAYAQGYPYSVTNRQYRPWYHVGIVCDVRDGLVTTIQFHDRSSSGENTEDDARLKEFVFGDPTDESIPPAFLPGTPNASQRGFDVLRPPDESTEFVDAYLAKTEEMKERPYALAGLLGFALATQARMLPNDWSREDVDAANPEMTTLRSDLMREARSEDLAAREQVDASGKASESCVSAVAQAIEAGLPSEMQLQFDEPAAPPDLPPMHNHPYFEMIRMAVDRLLSGGHRQTFEAAPTDRYATIVTQLALHIPQLANSTEFRQLVGGTEFMLPQVDLHNSVDWNTQFDSQSVPPPASPVLDATSTADPITSREEPELSVLEREITIYPALSGLELISPELTTMVDKIIGPEVITVADYIAKLEHGIAVLKQSEGNGEEEMASFAALPNIADAEAPLDATSYLVSPAMLWDRLTQPDIGFWHFTGA